MTLYAQKPPQVDAVFWDGWDLAPVHVLFPDATKESDTLMVPLTMPMPGTMPVPTHSYVYTDMNGNTSWQRQEDFEKNYELVPE